MQPTGLVSVELWVVSKSGKERSRLLSGLLARPSAGDNRSSLPDMFRESMERERRNSSVFSLMCCQESGGVGEKGQERLAWWTYSAGGGSLGSV